VSARTAPTERTPHPTVGPIGRSVRRPGDAALLRGRAHFVDDFKPPGCLHVALLRSPHPHAGIRHIDTAAAARAAGVHLVVTGKELQLDCRPIHTDLAPDIRSPDRDLLAVDKVRFVGEAFAAVVADSRYAAEDAAGLIEVEWDELAAVTSAAGALAEGAALVHESVPGNQYARRQAEFGDVDRALAESDLVIETDIVHPRVMGAPLECRGVLAIPDGPGLLVYLSTQNPHGAREAMVAFLGPPEHVIRVVVPDVGGGFGLKGHVYPEDILIPWLALKLGRAVKWIEDRAEHLACSNHSRDHHVHVVAGFRQDGRLLGIRAQVFGDVGAYGVHPMGPLLELMTCSTLITGPYDVRNFAYDSIAAVTTKAPGGAFRGVGMTTAALVHERLMDMAAHRLGIDPADIRRRNLVPFEKMPYTTVTSHRFESGDFSVALEAALRDFDYAGAVRNRDAARAQGRAVGIGIATYVEVTAGGSALFNGRGMVNVRAMDSARTWLDDAGLVHVLTTCPDIGQGSNTTLAQVAADALGIAMESVIVDYSDTSKVSTGFGTGMSRTSVTAATGTHRAALQLREQILNAAAWKLDVPPERLTLQGNRVHSLESNAGLSLTELGSAGRDEIGGVALDAEVVYDPVSPTHPFATHVCMVEVDRETGRVEVLKWVVAEDCGRVINPLIVDGQVHGGVAQGVASALLEEIRYSDAGQLLTGSFMDYLLPTSMDAPEISVRHLETPSTNHELGTKGTGEGGTIAAPAAIANAVTDALGVDANVLPLSPDRIHAMLAGR
jgi:aerobic carbon-monoxide dehydrogenase large subunit